MGFAATCFKCKKCGDWIKVTVLQRRYFCETCWEYKKDKDINFSPLLIKYGKSGETRRDREDLIIAIDGRR